MRELAEALRAHRRFLVLSHVDPDGDAIGSALGLAWMLRAEGKEAQVLLPGGTPKSYAFLPGADDIGAEPADALADPDAVVALDATSPSRLAGLEPLLERAPLVINVDHHPDNTRFGQVVVVDPDAAATAQILFELAEQEGFPVGANGAAALYTGIVTDTGRFTFSNSDARSLRAAAELVALGADPADIATRVYATRSPAAVRLLAVALGTLELHDEGRIACVHVTDRMIEEAGASPEDADGFSTWARSIEGVQVGLFLREAEGGQTKVSFRSNGGVRIDGVAGRFGGGGHPSASGARVPLPLQEAKERILAAVSEHLRSLV
jgi:phosphoesterase RecJ-like protein